MTDSTRLRVVLAGAGAAAGSRLLSAFDQTTAEVVRRCVDLAELLACGATGLAQVAVADDSLRRLDGDAVALLHQHGLGVVVICSSTDPATWWACGVDAVVSSSDPQSVVAAVVGVGSRRPIHPRSSVAEAVPGTASTAPEPPRGRLIAVWGPVGAPGRTTVAVGVADELARTGREVLLVDADTYGPSVGVHLGLLDDVSGVAAAARLAAGGRLDVESLARAAVALPSGLSVLTGIARPSRWPELRPASLQAVLALATRCYGWVVVDVGFGLGSAAVPSAGLGPPDRDDAAVATLAVSDALVAVGSADPVGLVRLSRDLGAATAAAPAASLAVVANRVRRSAVGPHPRRQVHSVLSGRVPEGDLLLVPEDRQVLDRALLLGRTLAEVAPTSAVRAELRVLAARFEPGAAGHDRGSRWHRPRSLRRVS
jgi:Flp pilus assembly CpaE family ATPase